MDRLRAKLRALWMRVSHARGRPDDFDAELESHLAMHIEDGMRGGMSREEARRQALIRLGGAEQTRQAYRERNGLPGLEAGIRDLRYSVRALAKCPMLTAIAILSIGLGIGANATIFSIVSRFLLRPAPVGDPASLLALRISHDGDQCCNEFALPVYDDVRKQSNSFSAMAAYLEMLPASVGGNGEPERVWGQAVTTNFFGVTEIPFALGRGFAEGEDDRPLVVLGDGLWRRRFNSDSSMIGKPVVLSGRTFTVIGVAPPGFHSIDGILNTQFWVPLGNAYRLAPSFSNQNSRDNHWLAVVGRLKPGVTRSQAATELSTLARRFARDYPETDKGNGFVVVQAGALPPNARGAVLLFLTALTVVVLLVLGIACANVANLVFAQAVGRQREMAVRLALGATRGRLRRQMLIESLLLGLGGGALGTALSLWSTQALSAFRLPVPVPLDVHIAVDWRVILYSFLLSVLCGLLLGTPPAWAASRPLLPNALKGEDALARPGRRLSLRSLLLIAQVATAMVLLCVTGLFLRSLQSASGIDIGFRSDHLLLMSVDPRVHGYSPEKTVAFLSQLQERISGLPGVLSVAETDEVPLSGGHRTESFRAIGEAGGETDVQTDLYMATPHYFDTMGIPRVAGSGFEGESAEGVKTAVVNRAFVDGVFHGKNPAGRLVVGGGVSYHIVGVVANIKSRFLGEDFRPVLFRSLAQSVASDPSYMGYTVVIHTAGNPSALHQEVRQQIHTLDPTLAIYNEQTMEDEFRAAFFLPRLAATLFGIFGLIGLVLASVGLYGVMSYSVSRRTREIGIRMAMGAKAVAVERMVLRQGLVLSLIAVALGWPAAWMVAKLARSFLYGIRPHDALTFTSVPLLLVLIALVACWIPARRAASVDPMRALRRE
jgi:predicted permease